MLSFGAILLLGCCVGVYAFFSPANLESASSSAIAALSIIFGLSTAVSALLTSHTGEVSSSSNDPHLAAHQKDQIAKDDDRTLFRQKILHLVTLASIILGLLYLVALKDSPNGLITKILALGFASSATVSLLSTMFLPSLLTSLIKRNAYLQNKKNGSK